jgi:hypothetical protein
MPLDRSYIIGQGERDLQEHLDRLTVGGDERLTAIARVVCDRSGIWPDQLVGSERAGDAARSVDTGYLSPINPHPSTEGHVVRGRRIGWHLAGIFTDKTRFEVADSLGGHDPSYVAMFMDNVNRLESLYPRETLIRDHVAELAMMVQLELEVIDVSKQ